MLEGILLGATLAILLVAVVSGKIERTSLTTSMLVVALGLAGSLAFDLDVEPEQGAALAFLEITLALVLFSDATRIDLTALRRHYEWPQRMLLIGLPLAVAAGAILAGVTTGMSLGLALLVGVILAPTDAALAEPVLTTPELPRRIRQAVNVESGLNDGLALPALFLAVALIEAEEGLSAADVFLPFLKLGIGIAGGLVFGVAGAAILGRAMATGWMGPSYRRIAIAALALATFSGTELAGGSGFVAAFLGGMIFAARCRRMAEGLFDFVENESSLLVLIAFLMFGAGPVRDLIASPPQTSSWLIALGSLLLVRPLAIWISLLGRKLEYQTRLFFGWFGPRGLASFVFLLVAAEELTELPEGIVEIVYLTVALSVLLHGMTAYPASMALARRLNRMEDATMPEMMDVAEMPMRSMRVSTLSPD